MVIFVDISFELYIKYWYTKFLVCWRGHGFGIDGEELACKRFLLFLYYGDHGDKTSAEIFNSR